MPGELIGQCHHLFAQKVHLLLHVREHLGSQ